MLASFEQALKKRGNEINRLRRDLSEKLNELVDGKYELQRFSLTQHWVASFEEAFQQHIRDEIRVVDMLH